VEAVFSHLLWTVPAVFCAWRGIVNGRIFRAGRKMPILHDASEVQVRNAEAEWPLRDTRWPPPNPENDSPLEPWLAGAYARLADRMTFYMLTSAQVLGIVGGAWLGVTLPAIWSDYQTYMEKGNAALQAGSVVGPVDVLGWPYLIHLLPVIVLTISGSLAALSRRYDVAADLYHRRADQPLADSTAQVKPTGRRLARFLRRVSR